MSHAPAALPAQPLTLEGAYALHQFFRFRWSAWRSAAPELRQQVLAEAAALFARLEKDEAGQTRTALYSQIGHKGDLALLHFRRTLEELNQLELDLAQTLLFGFLEPLDSYLSVVEAGLYESSPKIYESARAQGEPHSPEWRSAIAAALERPAAAMAARLFPEIPSSRCLCFYPMSRHRGEQRNWYLEPLAERQRMMLEHGSVGRRYAGQVHQIITASLGLDDWEWGVTLFAADPLAFKKILYEMRFDEVSAAYGLFGRFYVALRLPVEGLGEWLEGRLPS